MSDKGSGCYSSKHLIRCLCDKLCRHVWESIGICGWFLVLKIIWINTWRQTEQNNKINLTCLGSSVRSLNFLGFLLLANLHPLKYMLHEQPNENDAPHVSGSSPWHAHVRLWKETKTSQLMMQLALFLMVNAICFFFFKYVAKQCRNLQICSLMRYFLLMKYSLTEWTFRGRSFPYRQFQLSEVSQVPLSGNT